MAKKYNPKKKKETKSKYKESEEVVKKTDHGTIIKKEKSRGAMGHEEFKMDDSEKTQIIETFKGILSGKIPGYINVQTLKHTDHHQLEGDGIFYVNNCHPRGILMALEDRVEELKEKIAENCDCPNCQEASGKKSKKDIDDDIDEQLKDLWD